MNRFHVTKQFCLSLACGLLTICSVVLQAANDFPMLSEEEFKTLSPADQQEYEARLKAHIEGMTQAEQEIFVQQEVEKLYNNLPPEEQKAVLDEAARIEKMTPAEQEAYFKNLEQELDTMIGQQRGEQPAANLQPQTQEKPAAEEELIPDEPKAKEIAAPQISAEEKAIKEAVNLINEIAQGMDDLSAKMESMVNLQFKFSSWGKKKKIEPWDGGFEWKKLKEKVTIFRDQLEKLKDRDTVTKKHKFLPFLLEDKALYNQLYNVSVDFAEHEPIVRGGTNESVTQPVRARSNKALRELIKTFTNLFFGSHNIITELNNLFAKFEPEAKKIAGKEEKAQQKALAESRQPVQSSGVKVVGTSRDREGGYHPSSYGEDYGNMGREYGAGPSGSPYPGAYGSPYGGEGNHGFERATSPEHTGAGGAGSTTTPKEKEQAKAESGKAPEVKNARMNKLVKTLDRRLEVVTDLFAEVGEFKNIRGYLSEDKVDLEFAEKSIHGMASGIKTTTVAITGIIEKIKTMSSAEKAKYKNDVKNAIDLIKSDVEKLNTDLSGITESSARSATMKYAHFGIEPKEIETIRTKGAEPAASPEQKKNAKIYAIEVKTTLPELKKVAEDFLKKVSEFNAL
jgi:hypothetical protein